MWNPDETLLASAHETLEEAGQSLTDDESDALIASTLLEAAGTLAFLGRGEDVRRAMAERLTSLRPALERAISELDGALLSQALLEVRMLARKLQLAEDEEFPLLEEHIIEELGVRDRFELIIEGARVLLEADPELSSAVRSSLDSFDQTLTKELWRLLPLGSRRAALSAWATPALRSRLWWWHRGSELPHTALTDLGTAAQIIHLFPEAREELERLIQAERDLEDLTHQ